MIHPAVLCLALTLVVVQLPAHADEVCIEDWSTAAPVVKAEGLASVADVVALARKRVKGDVVKVTLCMKGSDYVYRMLVRGADGRHSRVLVNAKHPFAR